jgi:DNA helicase-2/ATP-dependent DNA helicase PcrA
VDPSKILLISFTRTAAHDLADKLSALSVPGAEKVRATTIHSYCFELLNREVFFELTGRVSRPLLEHEVKLMLRDLQMVDANLRERESRLLAFEAGWARAESDHPVLAAVPEDQRFEREVLGWLRHHRGMLIGEVVPIAYSVL